MAAGFGVAAALGVAERRPFAVAALGVAAGFTVAAALGVAAGFEPAAEAGALAGVGPAG